jgi:pimeloyl-ACP methyl ester carboxylesterase
MSTIPADYNSRISIRGSGPAIVLVPGMDGTGELFYRQVPLLQKSYTVATYALRDDAASMDVLADDLKKVIEQAAPATRRALVMAESFGGTVALATALKHPENVAGLIILNSFPFFAPQFRLRLAIAGVSLMPWGAMSAVRYVTALFMHSRRTHPAELKRFIELTSQTTRAGYRNRLKILQTYDVRDRLCEIGCPTLFLAAEQDHLIPSLSQARFMAARVPSSAVRVLSGHGHICLIAPDLNVAEILAEWQNASPPSA